MIDSSLRIIEIGVSPEPRPRSCPAVVLADARLHDSPRGGCAGNMTRPRRPELEFSCLFFFGAQTWNVFRCRVKDRQKKDGADGAA